MNISKLTWKNILAKPWATTLSLILLVLGVGIISLILLLGNQVRTQFEKNIRGIDMVVGAKGSPLQLILSAVFQVDTPTGNIPFTQVENLKRNRLVGKVIPLSFGDSYQGFRIVGTDTSYSNLYGGKLTQGNYWQNVMEVTLGASVSRGLGLNVGDHFESAHGLAAEGERHDLEFRVVGILEFSGSVLDQLILTSTESVWAVHEHEMEEDQVKSRDVTAALIKFRSPMGVITLPRTINQNTNLQAAIPAFEMNRLMSLLGIGIETLTLMGVVIMIVSGISVFISLLTSFSQRKYEMALMRSYGATRFQLMRMVIQEGLFLSFIGYLLGIGLSRIALFVVSGITENTYHYDLLSLSPMAEELLLLAAALLIGFLAAIIPAVQVYSVNISKTLTEG